MHKNATDIWHFLASGVTHIYGFVLFAQSQPWPRWGPPSPMADAANATAMDFLAVSAIAFCHPAIVTCHSAAPTQPIIGLFG